MKRFVLIAMFVAVFVMAGCGVGKMRTEAISEYQVGHVEQAEKLFNQVLQREPSDARSLYYLGRIYHGRGRYEMAISYYQQALGADPSLTDARKWLERAVERTGTTGEKLLIMEP